MKTKCIYALVPDIRRAVAGQRCPTHILVIMCGRVIQSSGPLRYGIVEGMDMRLLGSVMEPKQPTFSISVVPCNGCTACCHGPIMLHPGLGDDAANYESELTLYGMKLKQKRDGSCIYLDDHKCSIWPNTPAVCRAFDCRAYVRAGLHLRDPLGDEAVTAAGKARL